MAALRELKERTPHSYDTLAARLNVSRSTLHRYCTGKAVPPDFQLVEELAQHSGAEGREVARLRRSWDLARESQSATGQQPSAADKPAEKADQEKPAAEEPAPEGPTAAGEAPDGEGAGDAAAPAAVPEPSGGETPDAGVPAGPDVAAGMAERDAVAVPAMPRWRRGPWISAALCVAVLVTAVLTWNIRGAIENEAVAATPGSAASDGERRPGDDRKLSAPECEGLITMGQQDDCVLEVQELLAGRGVPIGIDGNFGPETLRRVMAFQVLAGLDIDGVVGDQVKEALSTSDVSMTTWSPEQVAKRVREVFTEEPELAVRIADCQSLLDPLHILPNTDGSRNWGVFQISDARLRDLRATPRDALDPEWNIQAAHRLWAQNNDFSHWPHCQAAAEGEEEPQSEKE